MFARHLSLVDFRSWPAAEVPLERGVNVLIGRNGTGKTNLVEALGYLATLSSHRVATDAPLIRRGAERAVVRAAVESEGRELLLELEITAGRANRARINRAPLTRPRDILGVLRTVLFAPEDLALVRGDPTERRKFLDELLVMRTPRLAGVRADYDRVLKQRNALLKTAGSARRSGGTLATLDVWDEHLSAVGAELVHARLGLVAQLRPHVAAAYADVAGADEAVDLRYRSSVPLAVVSGAVVSGAVVSGAVVSGRAVSSAGLSSATVSSGTEHEALRPSAAGPEPEETGVAESQPEPEETGVAESQLEQTSAAGPEDVQTAPRPEAAPFKVTHFEAEDGGPNESIANLRTSMLAELAAVRGRELDRGISLVGPHRDELELILADGPARGYASHGESWSFALALRLGAFALLRSDGVDPVLVLDDVFAELDVGRRDRLADLVADADQVLITAAVGADVPGALGGVRLLVGPDGFVLG